MEPTTEQWNVWYTSAQNYREERSPNKKHSKTRYLAEEKSELMNKYLKYFTQFTNSIDFDKLWKEQL